MASAGASGAPNLSKKPKQVRSEQPDLCTGIKEKGHTLFLFAAIRVTSVD